MRNYHVYKIEAAGDFNLWSMLWHDTESDQWGLHQLRVSGEFYSSQGDRNWAWKQAKKAAKLARGMAFLHKPGLPIGCPEYTTAHADYRWAA